MLACDSYFDPKVGARQCPGNVRKVLHFKVFTATSRLVRHMEHFRFTPAALVPPGVEDLSKTPWRSSKPGVHLRFPKLELSFRLVSTQRVPTQE